MVTVELPEELDEQFMSLIPEQRSVVHDLMLKGTILGYALADDHSKLWITIVAQNSNEVRRTMRQFPIYPYIKAHISELAFHEHIAFQLPEMSLN